MTAEYETITADWNVRGREPVLLRHGGQNLLACHRLDDETAAVVLRDLEGDADTVLSESGADVTGLAAVSTGREVLVVWGQLRDGLYQLVCGGPDRQPETITSGAAPAIEPALTTAGDGTAALVYQTATPDGQYVIHLRRFVDGRWGEARCVGDTPGNNWSPAVCACTDGKLAVAWDGYASGSYDIYLRFIAAEGRLYPTQRLTGDDSFHAHAALAPAPEGQVWLAWNRGTPEWGKDNQPVRQGGRMFEHNFLHVRRFLEMRRVSPDGAWPVHPAIQRDVLDMQLPGQHHERPRLFGGGDGPLLLSFRYNVGEPRGGHRNDNRWQAVVTSYDGKAFTPCVELGRANGLSTGGISLLPQERGRALAVAAGEGSEGGPETLSTKLHSYSLEGLAEGFESIAPPVRETVWAAPAGRQRPPRHVAEHDGRSYGLYFGDVHRHTEFSFCRTSIDGSLEEVFRYARDAAQMDFAMSADHDREEKHQDMWREVLQAADRYHVPGRFVTFFGYEWIGSDRNRRHRNVVSTQRLPMPPFEFEDYGETGPRGKELQRDVKKLWATLPRGQAFTLAHHSGCNMSLCWGLDSGEAADPELEPLVEIFQSSRGSSEYLGAPTQCNHFYTSGQYERQFGVQEGMVDVALGQGLRLGFVASSDHMSTHGSYACVYASDCTREALMEALLARRCYAASDRILCEFRLSEGFMGEEIKAGTEPLTAHIRFAGTGPLREVALMRDSQPYRTWQPAGAEFEAAIDLPADECRGHYFYARAQQEDSNLAWASPIWVD